MKLIDILVQELPKRGGWPEGATYARQDGDREICFMGCKDVRYDFHVEHMADDVILISGTGELSAVTREQYEVACNTWSGKGLPPVGCVVELMDDTQSSTWGNVRIKFWGHSFAVWDDHGDECSNHICHVKVRPIRSEADGKRNKAVDTLQNREIMDKFWITRWYRSR